MAVMEAEPATKRRGNCQTTKADGTPCGANATADGHCYFHSPTNRDKHRQTSQKGAQKAASARRARRESRAKEIRSGREVLRSAFASDEEWRAALIDAYRRPIVEGTKDARAAANDLINQIEGKPQQNIQARHEHTLIVVSRLQEALSTGADVELPAGDVREIEAA